MAVNPGPLSAAVSEDRWTAEEVALLAALPPTLSGRIHTLLRDRDHYLALHAALIDVERATSLDERLRTFVHAIQSIGFGRVGIAIREGDHDGPRCIAVGMEQHEVLALSDLRHGGAEWGSGGTHVLPLRTPAGHPVATLVLGDPADDGPSAVARLRAIELFAQQVVHHIERVRLSELTARQAERLQRLQIVGSALARSLDEREIALEVARGVSQLIACDSVVVVQPDLERATVTPLVRLAAGSELPLPEVPLGDGVIARVARTGQPVLVAEPHPAASGLIGADALVVASETPVASLLAVPLRMGLHLVAVLAVASGRRDAFNDDDADLLLTMGAQAASALSNARLYSESQRERRQTEALADVARAVSESLRMGEVMRLILRHAMSLLGAEGACVALKRDDYLHVVAAAGTGDLLAGLMLPVRASISGRAVLAQTAVISNSVADDPEVNRQAQRLVRIRNTVVVPLSTARGVIGTLSVFNRGADFEQPDARILQRLADHVAVAIVNARLYEELAESSREWTVAFNAIPTGMVVIDDDGRIVRYNSRALQLGHFETHHRELVGRQFYEAVLAEPRAIAEGCPLWRALQDGVLGRETMRSPARGLLFDVVASPHPNGGAVVTFEDVTAAHTLAERNRLVLETANDGILVVDPQRRISFANPAAEAILAVRGDLVGTPLASLVATDLVDDMEAHATATFEGDARRFDSVIVRADGERRQVAVSQAALRDVTRVIGLVVALRDITDERRARDAVAQSEARYRNIFETATDPLFTLDTHGSVTSSNDATGLLLGASREELLGRPFVSWVEASDCETVAAAFADTGRGRGHPFACRVRRSNGEVRRLAATTTPIRHGGKVTGVLVLARDVTEHLERDAALARSEARYTDLVESASDAIFTVDTNGNFTSVNRALEQATGRPREQLLGTHFDGVIDARDRDELWSTHRDALNGRRQRQELRYLDANGVSRPAAMLASPIVDGDAIVGVLGVVRDVGEEKLLVEQLVQQEKLAAIGQLVSGVAHELNNPLASVMAFSQLVLAESDAADREESLRTIHNEAKRAAKIVSNLLTFARQHPPQRTTTSINDVIASTLELRRYALKVHGVELGEHLDGALPSIWADPFQLQQVFLNLLGNAEQALRGWEGERRIVVATEARAGRIFVTVRDSGPGIPASEIDQIFNPFYTTKGIGKGTGLGLSVSDGIIREHGGSIRAESADGGGASFVVELPIIAPPGAVPAVTTEPPKAQSASRTVSMLVVDDEPAIRSAIMRYFVGLGHSVDAAGTGAEAHALLETRRYDALLLDLRMPDTSGDAIYRELLERDPTHASRVVFLTGDVQSDATQRFIQESGRASVMKPFTFDELTRVVLAQAAR
ncbi:MAG TPA: PAS domain S-box protein [Gemmatimonadaceae bacterium]|nr:PAS domain S-box protein [Gemmatimonadaceae bacterium]